MGKGSMTTKMRQRISQAKKKARIKKRITVAKPGRR